MLVCTSGEGDGLTTVVIADHSPMDCQLLTHAIQGDRHIRVVDCATGSSKVISAVRENQPDVAVVSTRLQDGDFAGMLVLRELRALQVRSRVIMLLDEDEPELAVEAFRHGARGIFCRTGGSPELRKCIQCVRSGKVWASNTQWEWIVAALAQAPGARTSRAQITKILSKREEEVAQLVAAALSNRELSEKLSLSEHTIKNCLSRIFEKLGISTRTELVLHVLSQPKPTVAQHNDLLARSVHERSA
jgi:two-component system nitrate/nitrite response regulator NarL